MTMNQLRATLKRNKCYNESQFESLVASGLIQDITTELYFRDDFGGLKKKKKRSIVDLRTGKEFVNKNDQFKTDVIYRIKPLAFTPNQVIIVCPYCGEVHFHGSNVGGFRIPHCADLGMNLNTEQYYLDF